MKYTLLFCLLFYQLIAHAQTIKVTVSGLLRDSGTKAALAYVNVTLQWQFLEDELKTTATASMNWQHTFERPGRSLNANFNYTFHREDEKYFFKNIMPAYTGLDSFALISDEHVADINIDCVQPLRYGRFYIRRLIWFRKANLSPASPLILA